MRAVVSSDAIGSACNQPVVRISTAATTRSRRREHVTQNVQVGAANVQAPLADAMEEQHRNTIDDEAEHRGNEHRRPGNGLWDSKAQNRFDDDPDGDAEECGGTIDQRCQDLPPQVTEGLGARARLLGQPGHEER